MNVFVGCGSRDTQDYAYYDVARLVGEFIHTRMHTLVFDGCTTGLMGVIYKEVNQEERGKIIVSASGKRKDELKDTVYDEAYLFDTANESKTNILMLSDVLIFLPGGIDTIDELVTAVEAVRSRQFKGHVVVFNTHGFYNDLIRQFSRSYRDGLSESWGQYLFTAETVGEGLNFLQHKGV